MADGTHHRTPSRWEIVDERLLNACGVWDLCARRYRHPKTGKEGEFYYIDSRDWVIVVARMPTGELVLIRQFRWGADTFSWELPGGIIDAGEDPVAAGLRELREETGYAAQRGRLIGCIRPNPAILNNYCHIVLAEVVEQHASDTNWDEHEEIEVRVLPAATVLEWLHAGKIDHALALNGLLFYLEDLRSGG